MGRYESKRDNLTQLIKGTTKGFSPNKFIQLAQRSNPPQKPGPHRLGREIRWLQASAAASPPHSGACAIADGRVCRSASIDGGRHVADAHMAL